eukprot:tig00020961_g16663.t1
MGGGGSRAAKAARQVQGPVRVVVDLDQPPVLPITPSRLKDPADFIVSSRFVERRGSVASRPGDVLEIAVVEGVFEQAPAASGAAPAPAVVVAAAAAAGRERCVAVLWNGKEVARSRPRPEASPAFALELAITLQSAISSESPLAFHVYQARARGGKPLLGSPRLELLGALSVPLLSLPPSVAREEWFRVRTPETQAVVGALRLRLCLKRERPRFGRPRSESMPEMDAAAAAWQPEPPHRHASFAGAVPAHGEAHAGAAQEGPRPPQEGLSTSGSAWAAPAGRPARGAGLALRAYAPSPEPSEADQEAEAAAVGAAGDPQAALPGLVRALS